MPDEAKTEQRQSPTQFIFTITAEAEVIKAEDIRRQQQEKEEEEK